MKQWINETMIQSRIKFKQLIVIFAKKFRITKN